MNQGDGKSYCEYKCNSDSDCPDTGSCQQNIVSKICTYSNPAPMPPTPTPHPPPTPPSPGGENPLNIKPKSKRSDNFFFITADWGAPSGKSYGCQKKIAQMMRDYQSKQERQGKKLLFVLAGGDNFYYTGLNKDNRDYQFEHQWKNVYTSLTDVPWLGVYGNHDHGSSDPGCACGKGCNQFNSAGRPSGTENFWIPDYYWHYLIPEIKLEVIGLDTNAVDVNGLGGDGCHGGAGETCKVCGGQSNIQNFLNQKKRDGEAYMDQRAKVTPATTVAILQHYPKYTGVSNGYLSRFQEANGGKAKILSAAGHTHDQQCEGSRTDGCDVILTGGGGGYIDHGAYLGFTVVHLTDDGGYEVVLETNEVRFPRNSCSWEEYLETQEELLSLLNSTQVEVVL